MKQTAVEWLIEQMLKQGYFDGSKPLTFTNLDHLQRQAKEKEKEQISDAYQDGWMSCEKWFEDEKLERETNKQD